MKKEVKTFECLCNSYIDSPIKMTLMFLYGTYAMDPYCFLYRLESITVVILHTEIKQQTHEQSALDPYFVPNKPAGFWSIFLHKAGHLESAFLSFRMITALNPRCPNI